MSVIGLLPVDSKFPNLALMKLSAWHKAKGDKVDFVERLECNPDVVYVSCIFTWNRSQALGLSSLFPDSKVVFGGSGVSLSTVLPDEVEHIRPDYDLYPIDFSMGFTSRGCLRKCKFCLVPEKEGCIRDHSPLSEILDPSHNKALFLDNNVLASPSWRKTFSDIEESGIKADFNQGLDIRLVDEEKAKILAGLNLYGYPEWNRKTLRFAFDNPREAPAVKRGVELLLDAGVKPYQLFCYVLVGFDTTQQQDKERLDLLKSYGVRPYIMRYNNIQSQYYIDTARFYNRGYYQFMTREEYRAKPELNEGQSQLITVEEMCKV